MDVLQSPDIMQINNVMTSDPRMSSRRSAPYVDIQLLC